MKNATLKLTGDAESCLHETSKENGRSLAEVEAALEAEIERLASAPITQAELDKALKRAKAEFVMSGESITGQTQLLGMAEAVTGDYRWFETGAGQTASRHSG